MGLWVVVANPIGRYWERKWGIIWLEWIVYSSIYLYIVPLLSKSPRNSMCLVCFVNDRELIFTIAIFFSFAFLLFFYFVIFRFSFFWLFFFSLSLFFSLPNLFPFSTYENYTSLGLRLWVAHSQLNTPIKNESHKRLDWFAFIGRWCSRTASRAPPPSTSIGWPGQPRSGQSFLLILLFCFFLSFFLFCQSTKKSFHFIKLPSDSFFKLF